MTDIKQGDIHSYFAASPGCWHIYRKVLAREYDDFRYFGLHHLTVDSYALQHSGAVSQQTAFSNVTHLVSLFAFFELEYQVEKLGQVKANATKYKELMEWLKPPSNLIEINIGHIFKTTTSETHLAMIEQWAEYIFNGWKAHHNWIRDFSQMIDI